MSKYEKKLESFFDFCEGLFFILITMTMLNLIFQLITR
jgi:hypothetical protein